MQIQHVSFLTIILDILIMRIYNTVILLILKRDRDRRVQKRPHQNVQGWTK
jgi:hypothetical protein